MAALPTTTPQRTLPIKSFVVYLANGSVIQVLTDGGEGFFRQQTISGSEKTISTHECFVANGRWKVLTLFKGGEMNTEEPEQEETEESEETEEGTESE
jgi:hypothetical protein